MTDQAVHKSNDNETAPLSWWGRFQAWRRERKLQEVLKRFGSSTEGAAALRFAKDNNIKISIARLEKNHGGEFRWDARRRRRRDNFTAFEGAQIMLNARHSASHMVGVLYHEIFHAAQSKILGDNAIHIGTPMEAAISIVRFKEATAFTYQTIKLIRHAEETGDRRPLNKFLDHAYIPPGAEKLRAEQIFNVFFTSLVNNFEAYDLSTIAQIGGYMDVVKRGNAGFFPRVAPADADKLALGILRKIDRVSYFSNPKDKSDHYLTGDAYTRIKEVVESRPIHGLIKGVFQKVAEKYAVINREYAEARKLKPQKPASKQ